ncbi:DUF397 domain-containing protein [Micromonospora sp. NPDC047762]
MDGTAPAWCRAGPGDSKDRSGPVLTFAPAAWRGFLADAGQAAGRRVG